MLEKLKEQVCWANIELMKSNLSIFTWGNVSGISEDRKFIAIKPSGVHYEELIPSKMVVVRLDNGEIEEGELRPSSDTKTHIQIYRNFLDIGGITHTHSANAVAFAQAGLDINVLGTTHADNFFGKIPCTRDLTFDEVDADYEGNTGRVIVETIINIGNIPLDVPGVIVKNHGPFAWGIDALGSVKSAIALEKVAEMAIKTLQLNPHAEMPEYLLKKHFKRKHGTNAYYGQLIK